MTGRHRDPGAWTEGNTHCLPCDRRDLAIRLLEVPARLRTWSRFSAAADRMMHKALGTSEMVSESRRGAD